MEKKELLNNYIASLFAFKDIQIDTKRLQRNGLVNYITDIILSPSLRLGPRSSALQKYITERVLKAIKQSRPIEFAVTTGSYKNIYVVTMPHIDWAEVFQLNHLLQVLTTLSAIYQPGIVVEYSGDAEALCFVDNLKPDWVQIYNAEYARLLGFVSGKLPPNVVLRMNNIEKFYDLNKLETWVDEEVGKVDWESAENKILFERLKDRAVNNLCWNGREDWRGLSEQDKEKKLYESVLRQKIYLDIDFDKRKDYLTSLERIVVVHRLGIPDCYPVKSVRCTDVQYWEGVGVVEVKDDVVKPKILSPKQWEIVRSQYQSCEINNEIASVSPSLSNLTFVEK